MTSPARELLANATRQAEERGLGDVFIVDADAHHFEADSWAEIIEYMPDKVMRNYGRNPRPGRPSMVPASLGTTDTAGRLLRDAPSFVDGNRPPDIAATAHYMDAMAADVALAVPTMLQFVGLHPQPEVELNLAGAYNRWLAERIIGVDPRFRPFFYLPFNVPEGCAATVEEFGDIDGAAGFIVTATRYRSVHDNAYMRTYAMLEERGRKLAFHTGHDWLERPASQSNRFLAVNAVNTPHFNITHLANWIVNGLPERFPGLDVVWMEAGLAWLPYLMQRLDSGYAMRSSEAPALKRPPSDYIREMYFTSHPLESTGDAEDLEYIFRRIDAKNSLMWASGYPQWHFDTPSAIWDLDFLDDETRRNILGGTARKLFGLA